MKKTWMAEWLDWEIRMMDEWQRVSADESAAALARLDAHLVAFGLVGVDTNTVTIRYPVRYSAPQRVSDG